MKKLLVLSAVIPIVLLFSFTLQPRGIKKIGTNLYSVSSPRTFSTADNKQLQKILAAHYHITDFRKDVEIGAGNPINAKGNWVLNKTAVQSAFWEIIIHTASAVIVGREDADARQIQAIMARYAAK